MVNNDRIVPVQALDLISLYAVILNAAGKNLTKVDAATSDGQFEIASGSGNMIASEPIAICDFGAGVTSASLYFVPAYDFGGFKANGADIAVTGDIEPDGRTLYLAELASGAITASKVGF